MVICGKPAVTWFVASTNQRHSAFLIPHFTFRIPQFRILPIATLVGDVGRVVGDFSQTGGKAFRLCSKDPINYRRSAGITRENFFKSAAPPPSEKLRRVD